MDSKAGLLIQFSGISLVTILLIFPDEITEGYGFKILELRLAFSFVISVKPLYRL
jgi:hypothetical protein